MDYRLGRGWRQELPWSTNCNIVWFVEITSQFLFCLRYSKKKKVVLLCDKTKIYIISII